MAKHLWKPGESGNPAGRPKKHHTIPDILQRIGEEQGTKVPIAEGGPTKLDVIMQQVFKFAAEGKSWAVQFLAERTEGKVMEKHEVSGQGPIAMEIIVSRKKEEIADDRDDEPT